MILLNATVGENTKFIEIMPLSWNFPSFCLKITKSNIFDLVSGRVFDDFNPLPFCVMLNSFFQTICK